MNDGKRFALSGGTFSGSLSGESDVDHRIISGTIDGKSIEEQEQGEEDIIREVAKEEGLTYEEVKAVWDTFKNEAELFKTSKKTKVSDENKKKSKRKAVKQSRKRNR